MRSMVTYTDNKFCSKNYTTQPQALSERGHQFLLSKLEVEPHPFPEAPVEDKRLMLEVDGRQGRDSLFIDETMAHT